MGRLEEIDAFVRIADAGSVSRAAERARIGKSAMSRRLSDLEARLGVQLFMRTTRRLTLTDAGTAFLARARRALDDLDEAETQASEGQTSLIGPLKVAAPLSFGMGHLKPVMAAFVRDHPRVILEVDFSDRVIDLVAEGFDIALRIGELADSSLIARTLCPVRAAPLAAPSFWDRHGRPAHPRDLARLPYLAYSNLPRPGLLRYWTKAGEPGSFEAPVKALSGNGEFLAEIAVGGCGFLMAPTFMVESHMLAGTLEPVLCEFEWSRSALHVVYPPTRQPSARVLAFADAAAARFQNNPYWDKALEAAHGEGRGAG